MTTPQKRPPGRPTELAGRRPVSLHLDARSREIIDDLRERWSTRSRSETVRMALMVAATADLPESPAAATRSGSDG